MSFNNTLYASYNSTQRSYVAFGGFCCFIFFIYILLDYTIKSTIHLINKPLFFWDPAKHFL